MPNPRLAGRYAKSLVDLSIEKNQLEAVYADMKYIQALAKASRELRVLLVSPVIKADQKNSVLDALTKGKVSELSSSFITLLVKKGREGELAEIAGSFVDQYNQMKGIHRVKLTTAVPVSDELKSSIETKLKSERGIGQLELETTVDEKLIGGFVLEFDNNLVDASVLRDLKDIKKQFSQNLFIQNMR